MKLDCRGLNASTGDSSLRVRERFLFLSSSTFYSFILLFFTFWQSTSCQTTSHLSHNWPGHKWFPSVGWRCSAGTTSRAAASIIQPSFHDMLWNICWLSMTCLFFNLEYDPKLISSWHLDVLLVLCPIIKGRTELSIYFCRFYLNLSFLTGAFAQRWVLGDIFNHRAKCKSGLATCVSHMNANWFTD